MKLWLVERSVLGTCHVVGQMCDHFLNYIPCVLQELSATFYTDSKFSG